VKTQMIEVPMKKNKFPEGLLQGKNMTAYEKV
jgi:hypothetical protein